jgi:hypothetical protein
MLGVALIFYELLKPVSRPSPLLAVFFRLVFVAVANVLNHFAPLLLMSGAGLPDDVQARSVAGAHGDVHQAAPNRVRHRPGVLRLSLRRSRLPLFRFYLFPRILGALLAIAGLCYLTNIFASCLTPAFAADHLFPYTLVLDVGEVLWPPGSY